MKAKVKVPTSTSKGKKNTKDSAAEVAVDGLSRCHWLGGLSDEMRRYHDEEWGVIVKDDQKLFEFLVLGGAQAGLSWSTILKRRDGYTRAFANWDIAAVAQLREDALLQDEGIIRNKAKIRSAIQNAKAALKIQEEHGSLSEFMWSFVPDGKPINHAVARKGTPKETWQCTCPESDAMSKALKKKGFSFVGSTIIYAFMQTVGMINDHLINCYRHEELTTGGGGGVKRKAQTPADAGEAKKRRVKPKR